MHKIISCLEENPVVAAIGDSKWEAALESPSQVIFYQSANLLTVSRRVQQAHDAGKYIVIHMDLAEGIGKDRTGIRYLAECGADGIISTKAQMIRLAKEQGKGAIALHGKMIDAPIVARAQRTIDMAKALGLGREE